MDLNSILSVALPSIIALVGVIVGNAYLRRTNKEANDTDAFQAVTDQLFKLNEELGRRVERLEETVASKEHENRELHAELDTVKQELSTVRRLNTALGRYVKKLVTMWPTGSIPVPSPDEPVEWAHY